MTIDDYMKAHKEVKLSQFNKDQEETKRFLNNILGPLLSEFYIVWDKEDAFRATLIPTGLYNVIEFNRWELKGEFQPMFIVGYIVRYTIGDALKIAEYGPITKFLCQCWHELKCVCCAVAERLPM
jgi:hypothetical protein